MWASARSFGESLRGPRAAGALVGALLAPHEREELGVFDQVTAVHALRLEHEPPEPLEAELLHQHGRAFLLPRDEIERGADPDRHGNAGVAVVAVDPVFLFR